MELTTIAPDRLQAFTQRFADLFPDRRLFHRFEEVTHGMVTSGLFPRPVYLETEQRPPIAKGLETEPVNDPQRLTCGARVWDARGGEA